VPARISLAQMKNYNIGGIVMEPIFKTRSTIKLAGYTIRTRNVDGENSRDIPAFWSSYLSGERCERLRKESFVKTNAEYGACFCEDPETGEFNYVIGVEVKDDSDISSDYHVCEIPPATYAVFSTPPTDGERLVATIQGAWQFIFNEWFPKSGYEYAPGCVDFELYEENNMRNNVCEIWIPVVKTT